MLTSKDIAKHLHVSEQTVRQYARNGAIPFVETPGGHRRYDLEAVRTALRLAKPRVLQPLDSSDDIVLSTDSSRGTIRRAPGWRGAITDAVLAQADDAAADRGEIKTPFIGVRGTSRFVIGQGTRQ